MSALSRWGVIFVATHDSIGLGEDGPTHQPVEALINLRATPNVLTLRPADANEVSGSYMLALENRGTPKTSTPRHSPTARRPQIPSPRTLRRRHADDASSSDVAYSLRSITQAIGAEAAAARERASLA